tara:strand:- start:4806 stop:5705 length:900 start_codon:yes stop_codon:yes gene_type:complete
MPLHKNLSGLELHYPMGRSSEGALQLEDDLANAYQVALGVDNQLNISTVNGSEEVTIGNGVQNPKLTLSGSGLFSSGGGHKYKTATLTGGGGTHDLAEESHVVLVDTSAGTEQINLPAPANVTNQVFLIIDKLSSFATNNLVLHRSDVAEKIDNATSDKTLSDSGARLWLFCDGANWFTFLDGASQSGGGGGATKITLSPSQHTVTGTTETLVGSVYLAAGTISTVSALFGEQYAAHTASLRLRKFTGGGILHTFTSVSAPAAVSTASLVVAGADWYDVFLFTDDAAGVAFCSGLFIEY